MPRAQINPAGLTPKPHASRKIFRSSESYFFSRFGWHNRVYKVVPVSSLFIILSHYNYIKFL